MITVLLYLSSGLFLGWSLGANDAANVFGTAVGAGMIRFKTAAAICSIFVLIGAIAIGAGVFTYSKRVMGTVGTGIYTLSPVTAFVVVLSASLVLFVFASINLRNLLIYLNLPPVPLVPVSSSQAVVGAVIGIGIAKGGRNIKFNALGRIVIGWVTTPVISAMLCFVLLYFMQNVFTAEVLVETY